MVLLRGTPPPPDQPWKDAPHVEFRLYKDPIKMARSYNSLMVSLKRLVMRESANETGGTHFITNKDSINTSKGNFNVHKIPQLPGSREKYFVVVLYPPPDLSDNDLPMKDDKPIKLLFNFSSFYLIGFSYNEIWRVFNDAKIIGISQAAKDRYVEKLPFAGNYNAVGQNYLELIVGFIGQCETYNSLACFGGTTMEGQLIRSLCRTIITVPESTRFYFLQQFNLRSFYSGNLDIVLDSPVPKNQKYKNFSLHLTKWNLYSVISKNGENSFSITLIPTSGIYSFNDVMNFIALATNKDVDEETKVLEHGDKNHNSSDDHIDHNERGDQGQDNDEEDARDNRRIVQDNKEKTWFYQSPVMAYVPRRQNKIPKLDSQKAEAIDQFFMKLRSLRSVEAASTFILYYPSRMGFIENRHTLLLHHLLHLRFYDRTSEHQAALSFPAEPTKEPGESSQDASTVGACSRGMKIIPHGSVGTVAGPRAIAQGNSNEITEVLCRYSAPEELKPGGVAAKGKKTMLYVQNAKVLGRDVIKVAVAETANAMLADLMPKPLCGRDIVQLAVGAKCAQDWYPATVEDPHPSSSSSSSSS